jgi:hypothetical protein
MVVVMVMLVTVTVMLVTVTVVLMLMGGVLGMRVLRGAVVVVQAS